MAIEQFAESTGTEKLDRFCENQVPLQADRCPLRWLG
jgi:hypothetical protein